MRTPRHHRSLPMSLSVSPSAMGPLPNGYPFVLPKKRSKRSDYDDDYFSFDISNELLLNPKDIVTGEMIGEGVYSIVYKGLFKDLFPVAVKILQPSKTIPVSRERKEKFQKEVLLLSQMKHDSIVKFVGACIEPELMIVTELLEGDTLQRLAFNSIRKRIDLKVSLSYALDIARAMEYIHSNGLIHRDLCPDNIMLTSDKTKVKLIDLSTAREETGDSMTSETGTYRYMAPEVYHIDPTTVGENLNYDHKVDVYSFGMVFWRMLTCKVPFRGRQYHQIPLLATQNQRPSVENIPDEAVSILEACWAHDPTARPEFKEIIVLLKDFLTKYMCSSVETLRIQANVDEKEELVSSDVPTSSRQGNVDENEVVVSSSDTPTLSMQVNVDEKEVFVSGSVAPTLSRQADVHVMEDRENGSQIQECNSNETNPKGIRKKVLKMMLPLFKKFRACLSK